MDRKKEYLLIGGALIIVIALGAWYWWYRESVREDVSIVGDGQELVRPAREGRIVSSFPKEFFLGDLAETSDSYAIRYTERGVVLSSVTSKSKHSLQEVIDGYKKVLDDGGWMVTYEANATEIPTFFYAVRRSESVNITFNLAEGYVVITVAYSGPRESQSDK